MQVGELDSVLSAIETFADGRKWLKAAATRGPVSHMSPSHSTATDPLLGTSLVVEILTALVNILSTWSTCERTKNISARQERLEHSRVRSAPHTKTKHEGTLFALHSSEAWDSVCRLGRWRVAERRLCCRCRCATNSWVERRKGGRYPMITNQQRTLMSRYFQAIVADCDGSLLVIFQLIGCKVVEYCRRDPSNVTV